MTLNNLLRSIAVVLLSLAGHPASALEAGAPTLESLALTGGAAIGPCIGPFLSATGRYLTFICASDDVMSGDTNERSDTFIKDRTTLSIERVSVDSSEVERRFNSGGGYPSIDGRYVIFTSAAPLHPDLTFPYTGFGLSNAFLRDRQSGTTELVGRDVAGSYAQQTGSTQLAGVSFQMHQALFLSMSNMIDATPPPIPRPVQVYVRNWITGAVALVTRTPGGEFSAAGATGGAALSSNGLSVAFVSNATDLNTENPLGTNQLMIHDLVTGSTRRLSYSQSGGEFTGAPYFQGKAGTFSADGGALAVEANSDELTSGDAQGLPDVYVIDTVTRSYTLVSAGFNGARPDDGSFEPSISGDGNYVVFFSRASNLLATPQPPSVYVKNRLTGELVNVSASLGAPRSGYIPLTAISADGSTVAFDWRHPDANPVLGSRTLVYSVQLPRGPAATPVGIPASSALSLLVSALGLFVGKRPAPPHSRTRSSEQCLSLTFSERQACKHRRPKPSGAVTLKRGDRAA